jgi:enterobactin synthetase component D / holo-[acyl-carrier protein] synthase
LENPAQLSADLSGLFPPGVIAAELTLPAPRELLTSTELQFIAHCAEKRIRDFAAGRACAHRALRELGILDFSLLAGERREPIWPAAIIGSITHTSGYAAAVVARQSDLGSVGLDCEVIDSVDEELWSRICTPAEIERLAQLPPAERGRQAALIFAAKEAFYKCQFPVTRAWVGFEDVLIEPLDWPVAAGSLCIVPQKELPWEAERVTRLVCRFQFRGPWVMAAVAAPN